MKKRKVTYRIYPKTSQEKILGEMLGLHQRVYNAALEQRIAHYSNHGKSLSFADQCKNLTVWRKDYRELSALNAQSLQVTLKRLDLAFLGFFRRLKSGGKPGFPRFRSLERYSGWGYKTHGDGWRFFADASGRNGKLRLSGVGLLPLRGRARTAGIPKTAEILHKQGKWYLSLTSDCEPKRRSGTKAVGFDWGVETFLVTHNNDGITCKVDNPRHLKKCLSELKLLQQAVSRKKNKKSQTRKKTIRRLAKTHARIARRRLDFHHKTAAAMVAHHGLIAAEKLSVKTMTAAGGKRKSGLNREILSTAPAQFYQLLRSKAEEAGTLWIDIPTQTVKPSQRCYYCDAVKKKKLYERQHVCDCGANCSRDENSARVILNCALQWATGQELAEVSSCSTFAALKHETATITL